MVHAGFPIAGRIATLRFDLLYLAQSVRSVPPQPHRFRYPSTQAQSHGRLESCNWSDRLKSELRVSLPTIWITATSPVPRCADPVGRVCSSVFCEIARARIKSRIAAGALMCPRKLLPIRIRRREPARRTVSRAKVVQPASVRALTRLSFKQCDSTSLKPKQCDSTAGIVRRAHSQPWTCGNRRQKERKSRPCCSSQKNSSFELFTPRTLLCKLDRCEPDALV